VRKGKNGFTFLAQGQSWAGQGGVRRTAALILVSVNDPGAAARIVAPNRVQIVAAARTGKAAVAATEVFVPQHVSQRRQGAKAPGRDIVGDRCAPLSGSFPTTMLAGHSITGVGSDTNTVALQRLESP